VIISIVATLILIGLLIYFVVRQRRIGRTPVDAEPDEVSE
jgi:hypothetical protein